MNTVIHIENLTKKFKKRSLFEEMNFSVEAGETIGIVGENGCGKSVLLKMIAGLEGFHSGTIIVKGKKIGEDIDFAEGTGILINSPGFLENQSGFQNLKYLAEINNKIDDQTIMQTMEAVGLEVNSKLKVKHYSIGMKQKLGIAQAIMEKQNLLLFDEVFNGLDFHSTIEMKKIIMQYKEAGLTMVLTSHIFQDLSELCDSIYIIENKKIRRLKESEYDNYYENKKAHEKR